MSYKLIYVTEAKPGTAIIIDGVSCVVKSNDISKTGKHGHAKCRIEAEGILDGKKKVFATTGHNKVECPLILKNDGQILSVINKTANIMDLKTYETLNIPVAEESENEFKEGDQVEYWDIEGVKIIKKKI